MLRFLVKLTKTFLSKFFTFHSNELKHPTALLETPPPAVANRAFPADSVVVAKVNPGAQEGFTSIREVEAGGGLFFFFSILIIFCLI
jgi:hypothetical protein